METGLENSINCCGYSCYQVPEIPQTFTRSMDSTPKTKHTAITAVTSGTSASYSRVITFEGSETPQQFNSNRLILTPKQSASLATMRSKNLSPDIFRIQ
jgi:hypothetical protein